MSKSYDMDSQRDPASAQTNETGIPQGYGENSGPLVANSFHPGQEPYAININYINNQYNNFPPEPHLQQAFTPWRHAPNEIS